MTVHSFKNGITVLIPDDMQNQLDEWNNVKVIMSILLGTPSKGKPVEFYPDKRRTGNKKTWRSPKKPK